MELGSRSELDCLLLQVSTAVFVMARVSLVDASRPQFITVSQLFCIAIRHYFTANLYRYSSLFHC